MSSSISPEIQAMLDEMVKKAESIEATGKRIVKIEENFKADLDELSNEKQ